MKRIKRASICFAAISIVLFMSLLSGASIKRASSSESDRFEVNQAETPSESFLRNEPASSQAYNAIIQFFIDHKGKAPADEEFHYSVNGLYAADYPEYFAGAYMNADGELVIQITESADRTISSEGKQTLSSLSGSAHVLYYDARFSYAELIDCMTELYNYCQSEDYVNADYKIFGYGIASDKNAVIIYLNTRDDHIIDKIRQAVKNGEALRFEYQEAEEIPTATLNLGTTINKSGNSNCLSIGYPAKYTSSLGGYHGRVCHGGALFCL